MMLFVEVDLTAADSLIKGALLALALIFWGRRVEDASREPLQSLYHYTSVMVIR